MGKRRKLKKPEHEELDEVDVGLPEEENPAKKEKESINPDNETIAYFFLLYVYQQIPNPISGATEFLFCYNKVFCSSLNDNQTRDIGSFVIGEDNVLHKCDSAYSVSPSTGEVYHISDAYWLYTDRTLQFINRLVVDPAGISHLYGFDPAVPTITTTSSVVVEDTEEEFFNWLKDELNLTDSTNNANDVEDGDDEEWMRVVNDITCSTCGNDEAMM